MPQPPQQQKLTNIDQRNTEKLLTVLQNQDAQPNILTLDEFRRYMPLYTTKISELNSEDISKTHADLAKELQSRLNMYKPTHVIYSKQNPEVLLRLPQLLIQLKSLSATEENEHAVLTNYTHRFSDLPKVWSLAQNLMTNAIFKEQNTPEQVAVFIKNRKETQEIVNEFNILTGKSIEPMVTAVTSTATMLASDDFEEL